MSNAIAVAVDPKDTATLYVVNSDTRVFRSLDAGDTWVPLSSLFPYVSGSGGARVALVIDPVTSTTLYVGLSGFSISGASRGGFFKSVDGGVTWAEVGSGVLEQVTAVAVDPVSPATVYFTTGYAIYKSTDGCVTWLPVSNAGVTQAIVIDPQTPSTVYATSWPGVVIKSTNGGASWNTMNRNFPNHDIMSLLIDQTDPATLYVGTRDAGVFKSTTAGETWEPANQGLPGLDVRWLIKAPSAPHLYVTVGPGKFASMDGGQSWTRLPDFLGSTVVAVAASAALPDTVFAGTVEGAIGVFKSTDRGGTWVPSSVGLPAHPGASVLSVDPAAPTTIYLGTYHGVFKSTDSGGTWAASKTGLPDARIDGLSVATTVPATLYACAAQAIYKSTDAGATWYSTSAGLPSTAAFRAIAVDPATPGTVYAALYDAVYKSTDSGSVWAPSGVGLPSPAYVSAFAIDPLTPTTIYAATLGHGIFKSVDSGGAWAPVNSGLTDLTVWAIALDSAHPGTLYAALSLAGVFRSTDAGVTWSAFNRGLTEGRIGALAFNAAGTGTLYATSYYAGVFQFRGGTGAFHTVTPCRAADTRTTDGPALAAGTSRTFKLAGKCGIPADAGSASMNVTVVDATSPGHLRLYPGHTARPPNSTLNFTPGQTRANRAVSLLGAAGDVAIYSGQGSGSVHVIVDVNGYFQ
jgi:photosystem II stability/assembly factor-like uncharacterized protein